MRFFNARTQKAAAWRYIVISTQLDLDLDLDHWTKVSIIKNHLQAIKSFGSIIDRLRYLRYLHYPSYT